MKRLLLCPLVAVSLFVSQCSLGNHDNPVAAVEKTRSVTLSIATADGFDKIASGAIVRVSAPDMKEIVCKLAVKSSSITGTVTNISVGSNRHFEVIVYDYDGAVIYTGTADADIDPIRVADVVINLKKFEGGSAIIHGSLLDPDSPCTKIWFTTLTGAGNEYLYDEKMFRGSIIAVAMSSHYRSYNYDTFEFSWEITGQNINIKTDWAPATQDNITSIQKFSAPFDETVKAIIRARCTRHPDVIGIDSIFCLTGHGSAQYYSNNIYPYTYVDTVDFDINAGETRSMKFKAGEDICIRASGGWCASDGICWNFPMESKTGPAAGKNYLYPEQPAAACLIEWIGSGYGPGVFNGGDCWNFSKDQEVVLSGNMLRPEEKGAPSGKVHIHYTVRGGMVEFPD